MKIIPPSMPFVTALRLGYAGELRMPGYLDWIRTLPCHHCLRSPAEASHPNFFKSMLRKAPDPLAVPEDRICHMEYEAGPPLEQERLALAALYMLQAIYEGRLVWEG